jgi:hypothetical protein
MPFLPNNSPFSEVLRIKYYVKRFIYQMDRRVWQLPIAGLGDILLKKYNKKADKE